MSYSRQISGCLLLGLGFSTHGWALEPVTMLTSTEGFTPVLQSVSVRGNWIAGGFSRDGNETGAVYVYRYVGGIWSPSAKLFASPPDSGDRFGEAVAMGQDVLIVGAPHNSFEFKYGADVGASYVFRRTADIWVQEKVLVPSISYLRDRFGLSVAVDGNVIAVGSLGYEAQPGRIFVFRWSGSQWIEEAILLPSDPPLSSGFGWKMDLNGETIIASAPPDNTPEGQWGSIYVFRYDGGSWTEEAKLVPDEPCASWCFGGAVALHGDLLAGVDSGKVAIFRHSLGTWGKEAEIVGTDTVPSDGFGAALSLDETLLAVGAPTDDPAPSGQSGSGYLFDYNGVSWTQRTKIVRPLPNADFGSTVAVGGTWMVIGTTPSQGPGPSYVYCVGKDAPCIPAMSRWGIALLAILLVAVGCARLRRRAFGVVSVLCSLLPVIALGEDPRLASPHHPEQLLVGFKAGTAAPARQAAHLAAGGETRWTDPYVEGLTLVRIPSRNLSAALDAYARDPSVLYAEPDYEGEVFAVSNDTYFTSLWGMHNTGQSGGTVDADIDAVEAWDFWQGDANFRIAVLDTGAKLDHEDLKANIWCNPAECPGVYESQGWCNPALCALVHDVNGDGCPGVCGVDDDGDGLVDEAPWFTPQFPAAWDDDENGWADDFSGWNFAPNTQSPPPQQPYDVQSDYYHGTHMSGIIGAVGNNSVGVTGVNWRCKIVVLKISQPPPLAGVINVSDAIAALNYVIANKLKLSNNSYGWYEFSQAHFNKIAGTRDLVGHLFVAAVGNNGTNNDGTSPAYPASYNLSNIIAVAATNRNDGLGEWSGGSSNYGLTSVDLGGPGVDILSTMSNDILFPPPDYLEKSGTSMAAAHVTGVVALLWSLNPHWSWQTVKDRVLLTVRPIPALTGITVTGGVVNAYDAINDCNLNGVPDPQDISGGTSADCNQNHLPDECDIASGRSADCEPNGVPDECEPRGACCLGTTCSIMTQPCCVNQGGTFTGVGTTCGSPLVGACCTGTACSLRTQTCCSGVFIGEGTTCDDCNLNGAPDACEAGVGPCCLPPNGPCILWTAECCLSVGGAVMGQRWCTPSSCDLMPLAPAPTPGP